jgi:hypothetical protein
MDEWLDVWMDGLLAEGLAGWLVCLVNGWLAG